MKAKFIKMAAERSGETEKGAWNVKTAVFETLGEYPKKIATEVFNDKLPTSNLVPGNEYEIEINVESREWQDKWFTSAKLWKCVGEVKYATVDVPSDDLPY